MGNDTALLLLLQQELERDMKKTPKTTTTGICLETELQTLSGTVYHHHHLQVPE